MRQTQFHLNILKKQDKINQNILALEKEKENK